MVRTLFTARFPRFLLITTFLFLSAVSLVWAQECEQINCEDKKDAEN